MIHSEKGCGRTDDGSTLARVGDVLVLPDAVLGAVDRLGARDSSRTGLIPAQGGADEPTPEELVAEEVEEEPPSLDDVGPAASADLVRVYLREIGRVALLTAADEVDLAKRVEAGGARYAEFRVEAFNILNHPSFGPPARDISVPNTFGIITNTISSPRVIELVLKFYF